MHNGPMLFADLVTVTGAVEDGEVRMDKVNTLSSFLRDLSSTEASLCVELLLRTELHEATDAADTSPDLLPTIAPSDRPSLDCEQVAARLAGIERAGAPAIRKAEQDQLMAQATADEQRWILRAIDHRRLHRPTFDLIVTAAAAGARVTVGRLRRAATLCGSLPLAVRDRVRSRRVRTGRRGLRTRSADSSDVRRGCHGVGLGPRAQ